MNDKLKAFFEQKFIENGLEPQLVSNIMLTVDECGDYELDLVNYDLFVDSEIPRLIDEILNQYISENCHPN